MGVLKTYQPLLPPREPSIVGSGGSRKLSEALVTVTSAQIKTLHSAPTTVIAAPPTGMYLVIDQIIVEFEFGTVAYTSGGAVTFVYHGGSVTPHGDSIAATVINAVSGKSLNVLPSATTNIQPPAATGLDITAATGDFASGDGTLTLRIYYKLVQQV